MSYCRLAESDVYAYACEGGVQFWVTGKTLDRLCETYDSAYQYAKYLRDECGLDVPSHAIEALRADALEEANHGDGSVVAELVSENAKLRELLADTLIDPRDYCAKYGIAYDDNASAWLAMDDDMDRRLRELGVTDD